MRYGPAVILTCAALALGACGGDDDEGGDSAGGGTTSSETTSTPTDTGASESGGGERYPAAARRNFLRACESAEGATRAVCECSLEELESRYSFAEFRELERRAQRGGELEQALGEIAEKCASER